MIIYVDIDETICNTPTDRDYEKSTPIAENIEKINILYDEGHTIIYWTARGGSSGIDQTEITQKQIIKWGAKNHGIKLGKPTYDMLICDKAINSNTFFED